MNIPPVKQRLPSPFADFRTTAMVAMGMARCTENGQYSFSNDELSAFIEEKMIAAYHHGLFTGARL